MEQTLCSVQRNKWRPWVRDCLSELSVIRVSDRRNVMSFFLNTLTCVGMLISLWLFLFTIFLFAAQPKEFFLDGLKKLEQRSHKCVELRGQDVE
jgi:hypothetical protein